MSQPFDLVYPPETDSSVPLETVNLAGELARRGFEVTVYAPRKDAAITKNLVDGVQYFYVSERGSGLLNRVCARLFKLLPGRRLPFHASVLSDLRYTLELAVRIRAQKAHIVHIHSFTNFVPVIRAFNSGSRLVLHMHSEWVAQMDARVMKERVALMDLLLSCSTHFADVVRAAFPESKDRVRVLFNGVDTDYFSPAQGAADLNRGPRRLLFLGRVSPEKGVHTLLDAFSRIAADFPGVTLDIVGPDAAAPRGYIVDVSDDSTVRNLSRFYDVEERLGVSYLSQLKERVAGTLAGRVRFCGPAARDEVREYYREADLLINPSLTEVFGLTVAEAMACGTTVVATRVGGMKDTVLDGETGFLVEPERTDELALAIRRLLAGDRLRREMGRRARERAVALFSWDTIGAQLASAYESVVLPAPE